MKLKKISKILLGVTGVGVLTTGTAVALVSCSKTNSSSNQPQTPNPPENKPEDSLPPAKPDKPQDPTPPSPPAVTPPPVDQPNPGPSVDPQPVPPVVPQPDPKPELPPTTQPDKPESDASPTLKSDYFVLPGQPDTESNRITNSMSISGENKIKWGTVPLPWKPDNEITEQDLINCFSYIVLMQTAFPYRESTKFFSFGQRKIESDHLATAFAKWIINYSKYFPYFLVGANGSFQFSIRDFNYIDSNTLTNNPGPSTNNDPTTNLIRKWYDLNLDGLTINPQRYPQIVQGNNTRGQSWINDPNKKYYVDEIRNQGAIQNSLQSNLLIPGQPQNAYSNFLKYFLSQIVSGMNDFDKFLTAQSFTVSWINYAYGSGITDNVGVCADYASIMSQLLNMVGVPTMPLSSMIYRTSAGHVIVWVYMDIDGTGKKWYLSDPTFFDGNGADGKGVGLPAAQSALNLYTYEFNNKELLKDTAYTQFNPFVYVTSDGPQLDDDPVMLGKDYTYSTFNKAPWSTPYLDKSVIGEISLGTFNLSNATKKTKNGYVTVAQTLQNGNPKVVDSTWMSRFLYGNGNVYWIAQNDKTHHYDLLSVKSGGSYDDVKSITSEIPLKFMSKSDNILQDYLWQQWSNNLVLLKKDMTKVIYLPINSNGIDWNSNFIQDVNFDNDVQHGKNVTASSRITDFYINSDNYLIASINNGSGSDKFTAKNNTDIADKNYKPVSDDLLKIPLSKNVTNPIDPNYFHPEYLTNQDKENTYKYYFMMSGLNQFVTKMNGSTSYRDKLTFNKKLKELLSSSATTKNVINDFASIYSEFIKKNILFNQELLSDGFLSQTYYYDPDDYKQYGFNEFSNYQTFATPDGMIDPLFNNVKYNLYYSSEEPTSLTQMHQIAKNLSIVKFNQTIQSDPQGWYVIESVNTKTQEKRYSNLTHLLPQKGFTPSDFRLNLQVDNTPSVTNYNPKNGDWPDSAVAYKFSCFVPDLQKYFSDPNAITYTLNYINPDDPKKIIKSSIQPNGQWNMINSVDNSTHGIYFVTISDGSNTLITPFNYLFTKNDIVNFKTVVSQFTEIDQSLKMNLGLTFINSAD